MDADQLDDPVLYRQELIKTHSRRLKALENRQALLGYGADVSIELEIIEIKEKIAALGGEIDEIEHYKQQARAITEALKLEELAHVTTKYHFYQQLDAEIAVSISL